METPFTPKYSSKSACADPHIIDEGSGFFPNSLKTNTYTQLSLDFEFSILQRCTSGGRTRFDLLAMTTNPDGVSDIDFFNFYVEVASGSSFGKYIIQVDDSFAQPKLINPIVDNTFSPENIFNIFISIDFANFDVATFLAFRGFFLPAAYNSGVSPGYEFNHRTKFFLCADSSGVPTAYCQIHSFAVWFTSTDNNQRIYYFGGLSSVTLANYVFNDLSGHSITDSSKNLGTAFFGSSTDTTTSNYPKWLSNEAGIKFTETNQYITVPWFTIPGYQTSYSGSITISFWIKYSGGTGKGGYIFRYRDTQFNYDIISILVEDSGILTINVGTEQAYGSSIISSQWKIITVSLFLTPDESSFIYMYIDSEPEPFKDLGIQMFDFDQNNQLVHIGGPPSFRGSLSNFRIFTYGSSVVVNPSNCHNYPLPCPVTLGSPQNKICLSNSLTACHQTCKSCIDSTQYGCLTCAEGYFFSERQCTTKDKLDSATKTTLESSQTAARAVTQAVNALTAGSPSGISAAVSGKIFSNIKFFDISYSKELDQALDSWGSNFISLGLTPDMPNSVRAKIPEEPVPSVFEKRDVPASFLVNFWESFGMLLLVAIVFFVIVFGEWMVIKFKWRYFSHAVVLSIKVVVQNFFLAQLYSVFGDVLLFSILEFRSPSFRTSWSRFSFFSALISLGAITVLFPTHILLIRRYQRAKISESLDTFLAQNKGNFVIFNEFKDYSFIRQSFILLLTGRDLIFSLILATMFCHPLAESVLILCTNLIMVAYLLLKPPFKSVFDATQQLFYEIVTLAVNVCILIMAIMDKIDSKGTDLRTSIGKFIIALNMCFNFGSLAFMLAKAFQALYEIYQNYKAKRNRRTLKVHDIHRLSPKNLQNHNHQEFDTSSNQHMQVTNPINSYRNNDDDDVDLSLEGQIFNLKSARKRFTIARKNKINPITS